MQHYFGILLFILVTCRSEFDLLLLSFAANGFTFNPSKICSFLLWSRRVYPAVLKNFMSIDEIPFFLLFSKGPNFACV